jgi:phosphomevalonate kinase
MTVTGSAPGKLLLLGEYAVLDGAPALVAAVDRRARAVIESHAESDIRVLAPDLDIDARASVGPDGALQWDDAAAAARLHLVAGVLGAMPAAHREGYRLTLSTRDFFDTPGTKLGLGSSAALTVALAGALRSHLGLPRPSLAELVRLHRTMQGGRGSGVDIAAALAGGVVVYTGGDTSVPQATPVALPPTLHWCCVFTGRSASTPHMLARFRDWREFRPAAYRARMTQLAGIAGDGIRAVRGGDAGSLLEALGAYADGLDALGRDAGIDIVSAEHREIRNAARRCGVIYKPSGAGGGDIGVGFAGDSSHIEALRRALAPGGYRMIDVAVDAQGLAVDGEGRERHR